MTSKESIIASLEVSRAELDKALADLAGLPVFDVNRVRFAAHTLNNYLTATSGCIALLKFHLQAHPDPDVASWLNSLRHATSLMTHTVLELQNFAPVEGGEFVLEDVDLTVLVRRACDFYRPMAERKAIDITFEAEEGLPQILTDRVAVAAVLDNLLSNAVKFSPHGKRVWVSVTASPSHLVCTVKDEGPGLTALDQSNLFRRGVRLANSPTAGEGSHGYGLAVSKELVGKLGGEIRCESEPGRGASFSFRLPAA